MSIMKSSNLHDVKKPLNIMIYNCLMKLTLLASIFNYYKWLSVKSCRKWERRGNEDCRPIDRKVKNSICLCMDFITIK